MKDKGRKKYVVNSGGSKVIGSEAQKKARLKNIAAAKAKAKATEDK